MSRHTFLALDMSLIPKTTKDNVPTFWKGCFSNDGIKDNKGNWVNEPSRMLLDGYNDKGKLVHLQEILDAWLQWSNNPTAVQVKLISTAIEYTREEVIAECADIASIWYKGKL